MTLTGISRFLAREPALTELAGSNAASVSGLLQAARPAVAAAMAEHFPCLVVVTAHPQSAQAFGEELRLWTDRSVLLFPAIEALPYERVHLDRAVLADREAVVRAVASGEPVIVVSAVRALLQPVQRPAQSAGDSVLAVGGSISLDDLLARWVATGYTNSVVVDEPGVFARRGGVIDVFPVGADRPVRIELMGNEIESLREFDAETQRSVRPIERVVVQPVVTVDRESRRRAVDELFAADSTTLTAEAESLWLEDLSRLETGASLEEVGAFLTYLLPSTSLIDTLPTSAAVLVDSAQETRATGMELWNQAVDIQTGLEQSGRLPGGLRPALLDPDALQSALSARRTIELLAGSERAPSGFDWSGLFAPAPSYAGRLRSFVRDAISGSRERIVVESPQCDRVGELLAAEGVSYRRAVAPEEMIEPGITLDASPLAEGWNYTAQDLTILTDHELFGRARTRHVARRPRAPRESFFADFTPGDYVVHLEHGIGRFEGVTRMSIDGAEREYALVQYAGTDRVYVPTDQLERLTRYVGMGEAAPHLNKLGGGEWQRARQRAKRAAEDIARELIDLYARRMSRPGHAFMPDTPWQGELEASFPFPETPDQLRAVGEVKEDMEMPHPMDRLVCADVGYGKTEVAVRAAFKAIMDGKQVAVLVPTTILAQQHFETFSERLAAFPARVEVLSRFRSAAEQREILRAAAAGEVDVLIGTHRLLQKDVDFSRLGLLIIDEEQRFGVKHKEQLRKLRETIDTLTLTATPIPRTLHMGLVGIREISVIETPPEGRLPIKTYLQPFDDRLVREAIVRELDRDGQVYIVHNRVATIEAMAERIRRLVPEARVLVAHGQMESAELERVMLGFAHQEGDVLLCSTIIENGLDIPNVNTIIVDNANKLGLTQLYQLRGRVGRSANQAYAYLLYPRDANLSHDALRRMEAIFEAQDLGAGFSIAMKDLEIRGAGNLLGAEQSGHATAIGFDLYTRMIGEAVEALRGTPVQEERTVSVDLPLTMFLPQEYVGNEAERLGLYRRLASVASEEALAALVDEMRDRFGPLPPQVENLVVSLRIKLSAIAAHVTSLSLSSEALVVRIGPAGIFDRVSLYRRYGTEARISTNVLRIPRRQIDPDWVGHVRQILDDMVSLRASLQHAEAAGA